MPQFSKWFALLFIALMVSPAHADDTQVLIDRLDRVERDMQSLQMEVFRDGGDRPARKGADNLESSALSRLDGRISAIENGLRELTGRIEELHYKLSQQQNFNDKFAGDTDLRLQTLEQKMHAIENPPTPPAAAQPTAPADPKAQYDQAIASLQSGDYPQAEAGLRQFIAANREDPLAANAQYWLGETHYVQGDYKGSAVEFLKSYKQAPKGVKAPDSLLKLALSLSNLNDKKGACASLGKLKKEFPKPEESIKTRAAAESKKLKCPA